MKAPPFAYARARSLAEAFDLLDAHGAGAKLLAGGQSLLAALNLRLSAPDILIDISRIPELTGIRVADGRVHIGALTTHAEIERSPVVAAHLPLLAQAAPHIAHAGDPQLPARWAAASRPPIPPRNGRRAASRSTPSS